MASTETLALYQPITPRARVSHLRSSSRPTNPAPTRPMQQAETTTLSAPASQESIASSGRGSMQYGQSGSVGSALSSQSTAITDLTSSPRVPSSAGEDVLAWKEGTRQRAVTPENRVVAPTSENTFASPMSITSPGYATVRTNGATKRTASGHLKNAPSLPNTPLAATFSHRAVVSGRRESISSTTSSSRAGEMAAALKARLGSAMMKVTSQQQQQQQQSAKTVDAPPRANGYHRGGHEEFAARPVSAGLSNGTSRLSMCEQMDGTISPPSKRRSGTNASFLASPQQEYQELQKQRPTLQPPADIRPDSRYHSGPTYSYPYAQPSKPSSSPTAYPPSSLAMSPPRTPATTIDRSHARRPTAIRTDTQTAEAERDALQALFQLGSPHTSSLRGAGSGSGSPFVGESSRLARSESGGSSQGSVGR